MRHKYAFIATVLVLAMSLTLTTADAQYKKKKQQQKLSVTEILKTIKPGHWAQLEGIPQKDKTVICTEIKILTGDFQNDDYEILGIVEGVDQKNKTFRILTIPIKTQKSTEYENEEETFTSFSQLKSGMLVEAEGVFLKDGSFLLNELEDRTIELEEDPDIKNEIEIEGRIGKVDPVKRTVTVTGVTFQLTDKTKGKSVIE